ncbi:hypothetical protein [Bacillus alveayuensis]|uniref:Uncharacterized protein n=1 Tax=Aeribacillus alveayuensis TaxID=279215 RepID=A0ABT9VKG6_9BACI|nr:hypothetical protein [Bacillus alveayuensis]MDQ0161345.1 hypothetical protein [Bacillus alveayuensis]
MKQLKSLILLFIGVLMIVQFRYQILNMLLGQKIIRHIFISLALNIPYMKERFLKNALLFQS